MMLKKSCMFLICISLAPAFANELTLSTESEFAVSEVELISASPSPSPAPPAPAAKCKTTGQLWEFTRVDTRLGAGSRYYVCDIEVDFEPRRQIACPKGLIAQATDKARENPCLDGELQVCTYSYTTARVAENAKLSPKQLAQVRDNACKMRFRAALDPQGLPTKDAAEIVKTEYCSPRTPKVAKGWICVPERD